MLGKKGDVPGVCYVKVMKKWGILEALEAHVF